MTLTQKRHLALLLVLLIATFFRFWRLGAMPPALYHDEAYNGLDAIALVNGDQFPRFYEGWELYSAEAHQNKPPTPTRFPIFFEGNYGREPLHIYLMALSVKLFGARLKGGIPAAIRAVPAVAGVLAVWTTYLVGGLIFGKKRNLLLSAPLLAAAALAISFPAIHFSRFGLRAMLFVPLETLAVAAFWHGLRCHTRAATTKWLSLSGALVGFGLYIYAAARLFPAVFVLYALLLVWQDRANLRRLWLPFVAMGLAALVVALPLLVYFANYPYFFIFRTAYVANKGKGAVVGKPWLTWLGNLRRVIGGLYWQGETHLRHNLPARPYLDFIAAFYFSWGLLKRHAFLLIWLAVMLAATIFSGDAPHFGRMTGAAPAIALLVGLGARAALDRLPAKLGPSLVVASLLASGVWTGVDYFVNYAAQPRLTDNIDGFYHDDWEMGLEAANLLPQMLYLSPAQAEMATLYVALAGDVEALQSFDGLGNGIPLGRANSGSVYFIKPGGEAALRQLKGVYPSAVESQTGTAILYHVSAEQQTTALAQLLNTHQPYNDAITLRRWHITQTETGIEINIIWQAAAAIDRDYTAFIHLLSADGQLITQLDRPPDGYPTSQWRSGELFMDTFTIPLPSDTPVATFRTGFYHPPTDTGFGTLTFSP